MLFLNDVNPTVWTLGLGYAIPHHTKQLFEELGYGLGLNSMQGCEAKHVKLAMYIKNTCNLKKNNAGCNICTSTITTHIRESVATAKVVQR